MIERQYAHGDVLLFPVPSIPEGAELVQVTGNITVALGEATGHHHTIVARPETWQWENDIPRDLHEMAARLGLRKPPIDEDAVREYRSSSLPEGVTLQRSASEYRYFEAIRDTVIRHEEHGPQLVKQGCYLFIPQEELVDGVMRNVID